VSDELKDLTEKELASAKLFFCHVAWRETTSETALRLIAEVERRRAEDGVVRMAVSQATNGAYHSAADWKRALVECLPEEAKEPK
jgi:hypothetical protein